MSASWKALLQRGLLSELHMEAKGKKLTVALRCLLKIHVRRAVSNRLGMERSSNLAFTSSQPFFCVLPRLRSEEWALRDMEMEEPLTPERWQPYLAFAHGFKLARL